VISSSFVELFDDIVPRPLEAEILPRPINDPILPAITFPEPPEPTIDPAQEIARIAITTHALTPAVKYGGPTQSEILLQAIILVARREPPNHGALRNLIMKFSSEYSFDF
jgi:hypothetical protein